MDTSGARRSAAGGDPIDMVLRARELKANIKLANASEETEASERALRDAREEVLDADATLVRRVETVREIRGQCAKQRELMDRYKSITEDVLRELQEKLRGAKRQLAEVVARKELADAEVERLAAETEAKHAEALAYRVEADGVAAEQRARGGAAAGEDGAKARRTGDHPKNRDGRREGDGGGASRRRRVERGVQDGGGAREGRRRERRRRRGDGRAGEGTVATSASRGRMTRRRRGRDARGGRCRCCTG